MTRESESGPNPAPLSYATREARQWRVPLGWTGIDRIATGVVCTIAVAAWSAGVTDFYYHRSGFTEGYGPLFQAAERWGVAIPFLSGVILLLVVMVDTIRRIRRKGRTFRQWWWVPPAFGGIIFVLFFWILMIETSLLP